MELCLGFACDDHVMVVAGSAAAHSVLQIKDTEDKLHVLGENKVLACTGEQGPRVQTAGYLAANLKLNQIRQNGRANTGPATAHFIRRMLADSLRSRDGAVAIHALFGSFDAVSPEIAKMQAAGQQVTDPIAGSHLYYLDYLGTMNEVPYASHGYGGTFAMALCDRYFRKEQSVQESYDLMKKCIAETRKRIVINNPRFFVKVITKDGVTVMDPIE
eukprot:NODE_3211_length_927_cov_62.066250_g3190_i0.p1 GENE.NODE_3211_length_927_cov_62.066250_g3190_i0~~NODE_3211_length_927_cov_62.066250_g3190_i0.p1  ORF type:complete len:216 (+),score=38.50 NODE_3211_length_927_cov_62.066250_g3190_i0:117-764(+)